MEKEHEGSKKPAKKHLKEIRSEETHDGHYIHHHTYQKKRGDHEAEPERRNVAVSSSPEEAGQHVAEQFAMNQPPAGGAPAAAAQPGEEDGPVAQPDQEAMG